jgi:hypothetical protein
MIATPTEDIETPDGMYWHNMSYAGCSCGWRGPNRRFKAETNADLETHLADAHPEEEDE